MFSREMEAVEELRKPLEGSKFRVVKNEPAPGLVLLGSVCAGGDSDGKEDMEMEMEMEMGSLGFQDLEVFEGNESEIDVVEQFFDSLEFDGVGLGGGFGEELEDLVEDYEIGVVKQFFDTLNGVGLGGEIGEELGECVINSEIDVVRQFFDALDGVDLGGEFGEELEDCEDSSNFMMRLEKGDLGGDEECVGFSVGDFVWGKIRGYPWWPGQIYDPSDASESAASVRQKGRLLVAFSDGCFAWCLASQLRPFDEDCEEMLKQGKSKVFVTSVEKALRDVGKLLELKMTCGCVRREDLSRPLSENTGIREGVFVPERAISFSIAEFEPAEFVSNLKDVARVASSGGVLELLKLKSVLSGFYSAKGVYRLAEYHEPRGIAAVCESSQNLPVKRKSATLEPVILCRDLNQNGPFAMETSEDEEVPVKSKPRRNVDDSRSATLTAAFGAGCSLPTKTQLIAAYKDFGDLVEDEMDVWYNNFTARIVFARNSDAERAFKSSQQASPFGDGVNVTFQLNYNNSAAASESETPNKTSHSKPSAALSSNNNEASLLCFIQQKLETMAAMVKQSDGKASVALKSNLECGMRGLLETVSAMG